MTAEELLVAVSRVVAKHPEAITRFVISHPNYFLIFVKDENIVAQICIETGELTGDV